MLPKSSQRVAEVFKIANQVAREYDKEYVGTEHVLLAIQREGTGVGAAVLSKRGITADSLRYEIDQLVKDRRGGDNDAGEIYLCQKVRRPHEAACRPGQG